MISIKRRDGMLAYHYHKIQYSIKSQHRHDDRQSDKKSSKISGFSSRNLIMSSIERKELTRREDQILNLKYSNFSLLSPLGLFSGILIILSFYKRIGRRLGSGTVFVFLVMLWRKKVR